MENNHILLVIENEESVQYLKESLTVKGAYLVSVEQDVRRVFEVFKQGVFDLVIIDLSFDPHQIGGLVKGIIEIDADAVILGYTDNMFPELYPEAVQLGLFDVIVKPIDGDGMVFSLKRAIEARAKLIDNRRRTAIFKEQNSSLQKQNILLAKRIEESTKNLSRLYEDLRATYLRTVLSLAQAIDARDHYTHSHSEKVSLYAVEIARKMKLNFKEVEAVREAGQLHDIGKIGIPDSILAKPSSLTPEEWNVVKTHPLTGAQILEPLTFLADVIELVLQHQEHYDGKGYPAGLKGEEILVGARIIHLADAYDSMVSARSYRTVPFSKEAALAEIKDKSGAQFDPVVVSAFLGYRKVYK
ncbi:MAG: HD domain-containing phosphohydrolase [Candidatus Omnitrophota bacterium]